MDWPRDVPLPTWVRTGSDADDFYRVDESIGSPRYVHWSLVAKRGYGPADIPQEVRNCSPLLYEDTIGRFPVLTREKPDRQRRFELLIGGRLIGYFPTRELAEVIGRRLSTGGEF